jgi:hypothetical protein
MAAFNQEHFVNVVWHAGEELNRHSLAVASRDFTAHVADLDEAWPRHGRKVDVEREGHFANIFNKEILLG